ncbi:methyl-accepting chemotaxis protein [Xanthomonas arboricola]|uniref:methyl-accepting chemotaxis protein n=1 Tax=Xanthomonas arboricola TaxID=56448 RepID=UPI000E1F955F|nr:MCP four helix bundle domain-containing protein [Xanthomonas arboricola]
MNALLQRYNVGPRLAAAFAVLIVLSGIIAFIGYRGLSSAHALVDDIVHQKMIKIRLSNDMLNANYVISMQMRNLVLPNSVEQSKRYAETILLNRETYTKAREKLRAMQSSPQERDLGNEIDARRAVARPTVDEVMQLIKANQVQQAQALLLSKASPRVQAWQDKITENIALQDKLATDASAVALKSMDDSSKLLMAGTVLVVLLSGALGLLITRSLTQPLSRATRAAESIAGGKLDNDVDTQASDESARLLKAMSKMQQQLRNLIAAQADMARRHDEGQISFRMDTDAFPGDFGRMARDTNELVAGHIKVKMETIRLVERYAIGDLSEDMPDLPGEKANITAAIRQVKKSLSAMNAEIKQLAQSAANGDFSARGDAERFQYDFRVMVESLNTLMSTADGNLQSLSGLLQSIAAGDLTARMSGEFRGVFAQMRDDANATATQLAEIVGSIKTSAISIKGAASEIAAGNQDLSQRTEQQAANLEETAASMEELTSTVKQNAEGARQANQLAIGAASVAPKDLIDDSVHRVAEGSALVHTAGKTMSEVVASVQRVTDIMGEISAASQEQSAGIEQVNQTITQMDETTQQNAALVEEATAAARALEEQAMGLTEAVAVFKTDATYAAPAMRAAPARPVVSSAIKAKVAAAGRTPVSKPRAVVTASSNDTSWQEF